MTELSEYMVRYPDDLEVKVITDDVSGGIPEIIFSGKAGEYHLNDKMRRYDGARVFGSRGDAQTALVTVWVNPWDCERAND